MSTVLVSPSDLRDAQRALYRWLRSSGVPISFVTAALDAQGAYLRVGVSDGVQARVPETFSDIPVVQTIARRAVPAIGDRDALV